MLKKLKAKWNIKSNYQLLLVLLFSQLQEVHHLLSERLYLNGLV
jgi:hypothetical protein